MPVKIFICALLLSQLTFAQDETTLSGFIRDKSNGETLPFANVILVEEKLGCASNLEGYFVISHIPPGKHTVKISLLGYRTETFTIDTRSSASIVRNVMLETQALEEKEVVIIAEKMEQRSSTQTGRIVMKAQDLAALPAIGEADVFRALQTMPGVKAVSEISSGLYVRGARWCIIRPIFSVSSAHSTTMQSRMWN
jgi:hypothetical protein